MTVSPDSVSNEIRSIRATLRSLHFARLDQEAEFAVVHARLERLARQLRALTTHTTAPSQGFTNGDGI